MNKVQGTIVKVGPVMQITEKFSKAEMVIQTDDMYPQTLCIEWPNDSAAAIAQYGEGDMVEIDINIRGRVWTNPKDGEDKYFTSLTGWKISAMAGGPPQAAPARPAPAASTEEEDDDLPF